MPKTTLKNIYIYIFQSSEFWKRYHVHLIYAISLSYHKNPSIMWDPYVVRENIHIFDRYDIYYRGGGHVEMINQKN